MDRNTVPHGGWNYRDPTTGWRPPRFIPFAETVKEIVAYRRKHPELNRSTDYQEVAAELESLNGFVFEPKLTETLEKGVAQMRVEIKEEKRSLQNDHDTSSLLIVLPFCRKDHNAALTNLRWMAEMGQKPEYPCLVVHDSTVISQVRSITESASLVFNEVKTYQYPLPPEQKWPEAANWSWQRTAEYVRSNYKFPWLWMEADAIPLKPSWIQILHMTYRHCGKRFMGSVVAHIGHVNGTAIYPYDAASRCPNAMKSVHSAWDADMRHEMIHDCYDASLLMQHAWGFHAGRLHPFLGNSPVFRTQQDTMQILPSAVLFHRCKDGSLITQLRSAKQRAQQRIRKK